MPDLDQLLEATAIVGDSTHFTGIWNKRVAGLSSFVDGGRMVFRGEDGESARGWNDLRDATTIWISPRDSSFNLVSLPEEDDITPYLLSCEWVDSGQALFYNISGAGPGLFFSVSLSYSVGGSVTPSTTAAVRISLIIPGKQIRQNIWCKRRDFLAGDAIRASERGEIDIERDARFTVRDDSLGGITESIWKAGKTFRFGGENFSVRSVSKLGERGRYLELLARLSS